jgi:AcrR family transcriptional regulator
MDQPASGRERRKLRTRNELAEAALRLFAEKGFEATTVTEIAGAADYVPSTFFRYFGSKEDVVFVRIPEMLAEAREALHGPRSEPPWPHLRRSTIASALRFAEVSSASMWVAEPSLRRRFLEHLGEWERTVADYVAAIRGTDAVSDIAAQVVAKVVTSTCDACYQVHVQSGADLGTLLAEAFDLLGSDLAARSGLETTPSTVRAAG